MTRPTGILDLGPQAREVARLAAAVEDSQFDGPTPCPEYDVRRMLAHLTHLAEAFTEAGRKNLVPLLNADPGETLPELPENWRAALPRHLDALGVAWRDPEAWTGMTRVGGIDLPGEVAALVAADELVVHGWDLAVATGQEYRPDADALEAAHALLGQPAGGADGEAARGTDGTDDGTDDGGDDAGGGGEGEGDDGGLFGRPVPVASDAPLLDRVIGLSGRDPGWTSDGR